MNGFVWFPLRHNQHILLIDFCIEFYCANTSKAGRLKYEIDGVLLVENESNAFDLEIFAMITNANMENARKCFQCHTNDGYPTVN
jgi:hypothetical protein